ncbi:ABC transporter permease subunit [Streptomyces mirabilis]|uniref:ABC transporter permease subunit n=1 Tax=Streptomyces mirabilis TaxID=68239 RepID=UPI003647E6AD
MIWLTWRQYRSQIVVALAALGAVAITLAITGVQLRHSYDSTLADCRAHGGCETALAAFGSQYGVLETYVNAVLIAVPGLIGAFWGAPLVTRELETGSYQLAWNQSVPRTRWLVVKLAAVAAVAMAVSGLLSLLVNWWAGPLDHVHADRFTPEVFAARGVVPIGYAAFAVALGVVSGVLIRRTVPSMAVTLAVFAAVQIVMPLAVRPVLMPPARTTVALDAGTLNAASSIEVTGSGSDSHLYVGVSQPDSWVLSKDPAVDSAGRVYQGAESCLAAGQAQFTACVAEAGLQQAETYQPADRYWGFQWLEAVIFLALAGGLAGLGLWAVRRLE